MKRLFLLIAIYVCITSICFWDFDFSVLDTGQLNSIGATNLPFIYRAINYDLRYKRYAKLYWGNEEKMKMRHYNNDLGAVVNYAKQKNKKMVIWYIQALSKYHMDKVKSLTDYSRNTWDNEILRFNVSGIKPIILGSWVLWFDSSLNGNWLWFYHFIQDYTYYIIYSKTLTKHTNDTISYFNYSGDNILKTSLNPKDLAYISSEGIIQYNVDEVINWTWLDRTKEYKIIKQSFDDFVKQIEKGRGL